MPGKLDWLVLAEKFISEGDFFQIKGAAREIFDIDPNSADGPLLLAEAELYLGEIESAEFHIEQGKFLENAPSELSISVLRAIYLEMCIFSAKFKPVSCVEVYNNFLRGSSIARYKKIFQNKIAEKDRETIVFLRILERIFSVATNNFALLGETIRARETLLLASEFSVDRCAQLYSNYLFFTNYRHMNNSDVKKVVFEYGRFVNIKDKPLYLHKTSREQKTVKIGYISKTFKEHALISFLPGLLTPPKFFGKSDNKQLNETIKNLPEFQIYVYNMGKEDAYSRKLREFPVKWKNLSTLDAKSAAKKIAADGIDILVDLAGHAAGSVLDVLAYRPAPVQVTALGYFASTGAPFINYILSDKCLTPIGKSERFTEECITLKRHSALCYMPFERWDTLLKPKAKVVFAPKKVYMPINKNKYPTFGCIQNLLKVSDDLLLFWKRALDDIQDYRLIFQNKTASTEEGAEYLKNRLQKLGFNLSQITLLPFAENYRETFKEIDIMLDTTPYPGGATTAETLYNLTPVITLNSTDPWSRVGVSILDAAGMPELIADSPRDYLDIMRRLAQSPRKIEEYKERLKKLPETRFMDIKGYSAELFGAYYALL